MENDEEFLLAQLKSQNRRLDAYANRTYQMAVIKSAHTDNPEFIEQLEIHKDATTKIDEIINKLERIYKEQ